MALDKLTLSGQSLSDEVTFGLEAADFTPPAKRPEWAQGVDGDGADLIRTPLYDNRTITLKIRITPQATMNAALEKIGTLLDLLQEAEKHPEGIPLEWEPAGATKKITFYVLTGQITEIPMVVQGDTSGFYVKAPLVGVTLTCKPFGYGPEESFAEKANESGLNTIILTCANVKGDVPAEGRLVVSDSVAGNGARRWAEWGLEQRYYNASAALIIDNEAMTAIAGTPSTTYNGLGEAYFPSGTKGTIGCLLTTSPSTICSTGNLKHIGSYRVKLRVITATTGSATTPTRVKVRISYKDGEGTTRANEWKEVLVFGEFCELDMGTVTLREAEAGTQRWIAYVEAYSENATVVQDKLDVDYIILVPCGEGYGSARAIDSTEGASTTGFDNFTTGTLSGSLNARTPAIGAAWATSGVATDFTVASTFIKRETNVIEAEPRFAVFGPATANQEVSANGYMGKTSGSGKMKVRVLARWVSNTQYVYWELEHTPTGWAVRLGVTEGGTPVAKLTYEVSGGSSSLAHYWEVTLKVTSDGKIIAAFVIRNSSLAPILSQTWQTFSSLCLTGGGLASGKAGVVDQVVEKNVNPVERKVYALTNREIPGPNYVIPLKRGMEFTSEDTISADSTGTYYGPVPEARGSRFLLPAAGKENRTSRIVVKAEPGDPETEPNDSIGVTCRAQVFYTPRYLAVPR